jgi:hypothetical protein
VGIEISKIRQENDINSLNDDMYNIKNILDEFIKD